ncbi:hypothetical protein SORBI_3003G009501 [Sorghum bicolor]|uniref:Uncharacterized protein n=1 Tax=Sorghum bicolor TaxID=4558 RepID=A0A1B6Q0Q4_SORBI|nr:hypothetical protein SORBI_3003G009501 [Sorghum bicolor]
MACFRHLRHSNIELPRGKRSVWGGGGGRSKYLGGVVGDGLGADVAEPPEDSGADHHAGASAEIASLPISTAATPSLPADQKVKMIQQARQCHLGACLCEPDPGAHPPAGAERQQLEVLPPEVDGGSQEPLRHELLGALPRRGVPADGPGVDQHACARRDVEPQDLGVRRRLPGHQQRQRRVQPERLLHHSLQVVQLRDVVLVDAGGAGRRRADLVLGSAHGARLDADLFVVLVDVQQHVHEIPTIAVTLSARPPAVVVNHLLEQPVERLERPPDLPLQPGDGVHPAQPRQQLPDRHRPDELLEVGEHLPLPTAGLKLVEQPARALVTERGARHDGVGVLGEEFAEVDRRASGAGAGPGGQRGGLLLPDAAEGPDAARAEEVDDADAARLAPVLAVGRERDVAAVEEALGHGAGWPARERQVARPHHLLGGGRGGHHHGGHTAQAEQQHRAVRARQGRQRAVRQRAQQVEVAQQREAPRRRRQRQPPAIPARRGSDRSTGSTSNRMNGVSG